MCKDTKIKFSYCGHRSIRTKLCQRAKARAVELGREESEARECSRRRFVEITSNQCCSSSCCVRDLVSAIKMKESELPPEQKSKGLDAEVMRELRRRHEFCKCDEDGNAVVAGEEGPWIVAWEYQM